MFILVIHKRAGGPWGLCNHLAMNTYGGIGYSSTP